MGRFRKIWQKCRQNVVEDGLPPKPFRDIHGFGAGGAVKALVGGARFQAAKLGLVAADLHVVEELGVLGQCGVTRIPRHLQLRVLP